MGFKTIVKELDKRLGEIYWRPALQIVGFHLIGCYWCWHYAFPAKLITVLFAYFMYLVCGFGVTCGVHRYFTHKSYKVNTPLKIWLIFSYLTAGQFSIIKWVKNHRQHHKCSDTDADPHNARRGLFYSHIGWLLLKKNEAVIRERKTIDMSDLLADRIVMFQEKYFVLLAILCAHVIPVGLNMYLFNEEWKCAVAWQSVIRILAISHSQFSINSFAHTYGYAPYNKDILPKENKLFAAIMLGEGWHNYHHVFPFDFKASEYFDRINWSTDLIKWWARMGWAWDLKEASPEMIRSVIKRVGDGSQTIESLSKNIY